MTTQDRHDNLLRGEPPHRDHDFDRAARGRYVGASATLSPQTLSRLRAARHAAASAGPARRGFGWMLAGGCAAVFAIAIAVQLQRDPLATVPSERIAATTPASGTDIGVDPDRAEVDSLIAALDENPDLYLWLAANDDALPPPSERYP